jgi:hypothetical protein
VVLEAQTEASAVTTPQTNSDVKEPNRCTNNFLIFIIKCNLFLDSRIRFNGVHIDSLGLIFVIMFHHKVSELIRLVRRSLRLGIPQWNCIIADGLASENTM